MLLPPFDSCFNNLSIILHLEQKKASSSTRFQEQEWKTRTLLPAFDFGIDPANYISACSPETRVLYLQKVFHFPEVQHCRYQNELTYISQHKLTLSILRHLHLFEYRSSNPKHFVASDSVSSSLFGKVPRRFRHIVNNINVINDYLLGCK